MYVTFKPDPFNNLTRSCIAIALEAVGRLTLDPSISLRLIALVSKYLAITSFIFLVISSGGTITLATCVLGVDNFQQPFNQFLTSVNRNCFTHINSFHSDILCCSFSGLKSCRRCFAALLENILAKNVPDGIEDKSASNVSNVNLTILIPQFKCLISARDGSKLSKVLFGNISYEYVHFSLTIMIIGCYRRKLWKCYGLY